MSENQYRPWESEGIAEVAYWKRAYIEARQLQPVGEAVSTQYLFQLLCRVMDCPTCHDEHGHAYIKVPARSIFDLGAVIGNVTRDESNQSAWDDSPGIVKESLTTEVIL